MIGNLRTESKKSFDNTKNALMVFLLNERLSDSPGFDRVSSTHFLKSTVEETWVYPRTAGVGMHKKRVQQTGGRDSWSTGNRPWKKW